MEQFREAGDGTYETCMESPIPNNARVVSVAPKGERYEIVEKYDIPTDIWGGVTSQEEIESQIMAKNRRHLQQTARKEEVITGPLVNEFEANHGLNLRVDDLLAGRFVTKRDVYEEMVA